MTPEHQRIRAKTPENAEARGAVFAAFRGCSEDSGTQRDRRERLAVRLDAGVVTGEQGAAHDTAVGALAAPRFPAPVTVAEPLIASARAFTSRPAIAA